MTSPTVPDYSDTTDFNNADNGFIAALDLCVIRSSDGNDCPIDGSVTASLWRQSQLCVKQDLYKVMDGIYQVRGLDISSVTLVESDTGIVVIDPLISEECARQALGLYRTQVPSDPERPVVGLIYTHSHTDHFGGALGVLPEDYADVKIIARNGFLDEAVSENVYAGNAMNCRAVYMYGDALPKCTTGQVGAGLGMTSSTGATTMIAPTDNITGSSPPDLSSIDGLDIVFQLTPGTEAPAEMNFYFPKYKAFCMAENVTHTMHNIQTLRGAKVRDARVWSRCIDDALRPFATNADVVFSSHHWPTWGQENLTTFMIQQRDLYACLHDQTLRMLNNGYTGTEIAEGVTLPDSLAKCWYSQGYYGTISHNVKAIYNRYMGWSDGHPAHLWELPPVDAGKRYVDCMGGPDAVVDEAKSYADGKDLRFAATLLSHVVFGYPDYTAAPGALADMFQKLGYGRENGIWRNFYLTGAYELLHGIVPPTLSADIYGLTLALELDQLMDSMAIRLDGLAAQTHAFTIDWFVTNMFQQLRLTLCNGALTNRSIDAAEPGTADAATLCCWLSHKDLVKLVIGVHPAGRCAGLDGLQRRHYGVDDVKWATDDSEPCVCDCYALVLAFLLFAGADLEYKPTFENDECPSDEASDITLRGGLFTEVVEYLKCLTVGSDFVDNQNFSLVHKITLRSSLQDLEPVILQDADDEVITDTMGRTAQEWAAARGDQRLVAVNQIRTLCVRLLLQAGTDPNPDLPLPNGIKFGSPLNCAARNASDVLLLKTLLELNADIEASNVDGVTPLLQLACSNSASHAMILLDYGANINLTIDKDYEFGETAKRLQDRPNLTDELSIAFEDLFNVIRQEPDTYVN
ncbi:hypothetical protein MMC18_006279 [Xylographa bjoerkii]|nr:hypothetical protein [Xylographa bjoerkii]